VTESGLAAALRAAVEAGDVERARDLVVQASEKERRAAAKELGDGLKAVMWKWNEKRVRTRIAAAVGWLGTATARELAGDWWTLEARTDWGPDLDLVYEVLEARGARLVETITRNTVEDGVQRAWPMLRLAVTRGLIDEPADGDAYVRGMVASFGWTGDDAAGTYHALVADPGLLDGEVWRIFDVDCSTELSNANWSTTESGSRGPGENRWQLALVRLAGEGRLDRQRLLDASLSALVRDFRPSMVGWYAKLHEALEPTHDERRLRIDTYLSLAASPVPAAVKEGLSGLRAALDAVPADDLARAATGPLSQKQKNLAVDMLRLLETKAKDDADTRATVLEAAALALGHERADVQERALALLERYPDEAPRAALLDLAEAVAAPLRARAGALTGIAKDTTAGPREPQVVSPPPARPAATVELLRDAARPLEAVGSVDELIELAASLLEGRGTGDDIERLLDGVSRLCNERPPGFERRVAGLLERLEEVSWWQFGGSAGEAITVVVRAWITGRRTRGLRPVHTWLGFLVARALEVAGRAARRSARPLLAFPTHQGGWIDPDVLAERERGIGLFRNRPAPADFLQARIRAFRPEGPLGYERSIVAPGRWPKERELELRPDRIPEVFAEISQRARAVGRFEGSVWEGSAPWGSEDALGSRWCLTLAPSFPELSFAGAAALIAKTLEGSPHFHPEPALEHALDTNVPLGETAWLAVGAALVAKSPDLRRLATDVLVESVSDGRFDADATGDAVAWLVDDGMAKVSRVEAPLRDVGRVSTLHAAQVVRLVEALVTGLRATPHGLHGILEVALEQATAAGVTVERADARAALERIAGEVSASSKLGRLTRGLLDLDRAAAR
jgi:Family of unknown function (DUF6493)